MNRSHLPLSRRRRSRKDRKLSVEWLETRSLLTSLFVTTGADLGAGSLRDAIEQANLDSSIDAIIVKKDVGTIEIESAIEYTGTQDLAIDGKGVTILAADTFADSNLLVFSGGANLSLSRLAVDGAFAANNTVANGVYIPVPADRTGELSVSLNDVNFINNGAFGFHLDDQSFHPDDQFGNSDATLRLTVLNSLAQNNGIGDLDLDGLRVDEGGVGDIIARIVNSQFNGNGADGLELDERGDGIVDLEVISSTFNDNGFFDSTDFDDGLDVDEADAGDIVARVVNSTFNNNFDEGLDFDEKGDGDIRASLVNVQANHNIDEGIKMSEAGVGGLFVSLRNVTAIGSQEDDGIHLEEEDSGNVDVTVVNLTATDNGHFADPDDDRFGLRVEQKTVGDDTGTLKLRNATLIDNADGEFWLDDVDLI